MGQLCPVVGVAGRGVGLGEGRLPRFEFPAPVPSEMDRVNSTDPTGWREGVRVELGLNPIDTGLLLGGTKIMFAHRTTRTVDREEPPGGGGRQ